MSKEQDYLSMSDEEIANTVTLPPLESEESDDDEALNREITENESFDEEEDIDTEEDDTSEDDNEEEDFNQDADNEDEDSDFEEEEESDSEEEDSDDDSEEESNTEVDDGSVDYKAISEAIFAPFKANGRMMQVTTPDEVRTLMQMGANYNKKMAGLKPHLKIVKMLDNNGLLDENKLNYLIDLDKKNPEAIKKLLSDSGVDPLDLDLETQNYTPGTYNVSDAEVNLQETLDEIIDTDSGKRTLEIVNNKWDRASRSVLANDPQSLKILNAHVESGLYDQVMDIVERERMLGNLSGMTDMQAYKHVGMILERSNAFGNPNQGNNMSQSKQKNQSAADRQKEQQRSRKRKAASSPTGKSTKAKRETDFDPLAMSDEEFEKFSQAKFPNIR